MINVLINIIHNKQYTVVLRISSIYPCGIVYKVSKIDRYHRSKETEYKDTVEVAFGLFYLKKTMNFAVSIAFAFILTLGWTHAKYLLVEVENSNSGRKYNYE